MQLVSRVRHYLLRPLALGISHCVLVRECLAVLRAVDDPQPGKEQVDKVALVLTNRSPWTPRLLR